MHRFLTGKREKKEVRRDNLMKIEYSPDWVRWVIYYGGNNTPIGVYCKFMDLRFQINKMLLNLTQNLPTTIIVCFAGINGEALINQVAMDQIEKRGINNRVVATLISLRTGEGAAHTLGTLKYRQTNPVCFQETWCTLCKFCNNLLLYSLQHSCMFLINSLDHRCAMTSYGITFAFRTTSPISRIEPFIALFFLNTFNVVSMC